MKFSIYIFLLPITFLFIHFLASTIDFQLFVELLLAMFLAEHLQRIIEDY